MRSGAGYLATLVDSRLSNCMGGFAPASTAVASTVTALPSTARCSVFAAWGAHSGPVSWSSVAKEFKQISRLISKSRPALRLLACEVVRCTFYP